MGLLYATTGCMGYLQQAPETARDTPPGESSFKAAIAIYNGPFHRGQCSGNERSRRPDSSMTITTDELFADIAGGQVIVRRWTPAKAHHCPIVLLHDSLGCVGLWRDFLAALAPATSRRVIAYDRLGFGISSPLAKRPAPTFIADEARLHL